MEKFLNTQDMWNAITKQISLPELLDYSLVSSPTNIYDIEYSVKGNLEFGSSEGIYLDVYMEGLFDVKPEHKKACIGTFNKIHMANV